MDPPALRWWHSWRRRQQAETGIRLELCDDDSPRLRAVKERTLGMARLREVRTLADLSARIAVLARQLEVPAPTLAEVRSHAEGERSDEQLAHLDAIE
ncbi:hypothetical protein AB0F88_42315 [Streptosporangium sp. NPDC023963]|uniref:hypothetical protein n=1 Tax=Streptosporangium sp. NPDC023963 TaxID=3155608 RepID=UPI003412F0B6